MLRGGHPVVEEDVELHTLELDNEDTTESYHYSADEKLSEELSSFSREDEPDTTFIDWEVQAGGARRLASYCNWKRQGIILLVVGAVILVGVVFGTLFVSHTTASSSEGGGKAESYPDISQLPPREQAVALLERYPLLDGHNDLAWQYYVLHHNDVAEMNISKNVSDEVMTDLPRAQDGGLRVQFWSAYVPCEGTSFKVHPVRFALGQVDVIHRFVDANAHQMQFASSTKEIYGALSKNKLASLIGLEGGHSLGDIDGDPIAVLRMFYRLGVRYMTLTHTCDTSWADSAHGNHSLQGLTPLGQKVVEEMNWLGMMVDISHVSDDTMRDALNISKAPVIFSHSSARAICDNVRNVPDDILQLLKTNNGIIMINFYSAFISEDYRRHEEKDDLNDWLQANSHLINASLVADHIDHVVKQIGDDHVGIGADFDGVPRKGLPMNLYDVSQYPNLIEELLRRGYAETSISKVLSGNLFRVFHEVENVARQLREDSG